MNKFVAMELKLAFGKKITEASQPKIHSRLTDTDPESLLIYPVNTPRKGKNVDNEKILGSKGIHLFDPAERRDTDYDPQRERKDLFTPQYNRKGDPEISQEHLRVLDTAIQKFHPAYGKWYNDVRPKVEGIFKSEHYDDTDFMTGLLASGSSQKHPWDNFKEASRRYTEIAHGMPISKDSYERDTLRVAGGGMSSGPKRFAYHHNLLGNEDYTTVDRHMKMGILNQYSTAKGDIAVSPKEHQIITKVNQVLSKEHGLPNREGQAALWGFHIARSSLNHPAFHEEGSPLRKYSQLAGGLLPPTEKESGVQGYGEYMRHNEGALRSMKSAADEARLRHPLFSKMAGGKFLMTGGGTGQVGNLASPRRGSDLSKSELDQVRHRGTLSGHAIAAVTPEGQSLDAASVSMEGKPLNPGIPRYRKSTVDAEEATAVFIAMNLLEKLIAAYKEKKSITEKTEIAEITKNLLES